MVYRALILFLFAQVCLGTNYYLGTGSGDGSDSNNGTATNTPWKTLIKAASTMHAGDTLFIRGGTYDMAGAHGYDYFGLGFYNGVGVLGTQANPIVVTNFPGETPIFLNAAIGNAGTGNGAGVIAIGNTAWVKIYGLTLSNIFSPGNGISLGINTSGVTNCELAYCTAGYCNTNFGAGVGAVNIGDNSKSNYVHHNTFPVAWAYTVIDPVTHLAAPANTWPTNQIDNSTIVIATTINWPWSTNGESYNVFATNVICYSGHAAFNPNGEYDRFLGNYYHNDPFIWWPCCNRYGGHGNFRSFAGHCLSDGERAGYAGDPLANDGAEGFGLFGGTNVLRRSMSYWNEHYGISIYDKGVGDRHANGNYIYNCVIAHNSLGTPSFTNTCSSNITFGPYPNTVSRAGSQAAIHLAGATNNHIVNCIIAFNGANSIFSAPTNYILYGGNTPVNDFRTNWFNNLTGDPLFTDDSVTNQYFIWANTPATSGDPYNATKPDFTLKTNSPCIDVGTWLTTTTNTGSGTSMPVSDSWYFWDGITVSGVTFPGDIIQLQGATNRATVTAVDRVNSILTLDTPLSWVPNQGVALAYNGQAPDMGAFESGQVTAGPSILVTPGSLSFGNIYRYATASLTLSVTNVGGGTLNYTAAVGGAPYSITSGASGALAANAGTTVTVQFAPTSSGSFSDTVTFTGGGGASIPITGSATVAPTTVISATTKISATTTLK